MLNTFQNPNLNLKKSRNREEEDSMGEKDLLLYLSGIAIFLLYKKLKNEKNNGNDKKSSKSTKGIERRNKDSGSTNNQTGSTNSYIASTFKLQSVSVDYDQSLNLKQLQQSTPTASKKYTEPTNDEQLFIGLTPLSNSIIAAEPIIKQIGYKHSSEGEVIVIGIAGGTGSGKTTLAKAIFESVGSDNVTYISHDAYYKDLSNLTISEREKHNFDHPDSLDTSLMVEHIGLLKKNMGALIPTYDYTTHTRCEAVEEVFPRPIILIEGILIFSDLRLVQLMDIKIYVDTDDDIRLVRRIQRDTVERGRSIQSIITQYMKTVRPMHSQFVEPSKKNADIIVPAGLNSVALDLVVNKLQSIVTSSRLGSSNNSATSLKTLDQN